MSDGMDIVIEARTFLGCPWVHQGRSRDGVDCLGLGVLVARATRGYTQDSTNYAAQAQDESMIRTLSEFADRISVSEIQPGDGLVIRFHNQRHLAIVGDYPDALSLIHSSSKFGKVVEHRYDSVWKRITLAAFRLREMR